MITSFLRSYPAKSGNSEHYIKRLITGFFAFWDKSDKSSTVVISTHGLIKKTGKTPSGELDKAERLRKLYFEQKDN